MLSSALLALVAVASAAAVAAQDPPAAKDLVEVRLRSFADYGRLLQHANDVDDHRPPGPAGAVWIYADDAEQDLLRAQGFAFTVLIEDLTGYYAARAAAAPGARAAGSMGGFRTLAEIGQELDRLAATYPNVVSPKWSIGTSQQGRPIWMLRVSDHPAAREPGEPIAWYDALHHAREPMSGESLLLFIDWLGRNYGADPLATRLVDSRELLFVPCANPDGYEYNRQTAPNGGGMWRKNRRDNGGGVYGVDLNRNYSYEWGPQWPGSSSAPQSEIYRGPAPFSEPEAAALRDALALYPPRTSISAHTYSNLWLFSWGYDRIVTPIDALLRDYGARMTARNDYPAGTVWELLYIANGVSLDYHYGVHDVLAFSPEIGGDWDGFWPLPSRIPALFEEVLPGYQMVARWAGAWAEVVDLAWSEVGGDGDPWPEPGEEWDLALVIENQGDAPLSAALQLVSASGEVAVLSGAATAGVGPRSQAASTQMRLRFAATSRAGRPYLLDLHLDYEGVATVEKLRLLLGKERLLGHDDGEVDDFGWLASNAGKSWAWERAVPEATASSGHAVQPPRDNPQGTGSLCWVTGAGAGNSANSNDVDGVTTLTSPRFRAAGLEHLELSYARWYANFPGSAANDRLLVEVSANDGQSWTKLEEAYNLPHWYEYRFDLEDYVALTDALRLRFTASDQPNNDITEALIDDVYLRSYSDLPTLALWGPTRLGARVQMFVDGLPSAGFRVDWSFQQGPGAPLAGYQGLLYLGGTIQTLYSGALDGSGRAQTVLTIPNLAALNGKTVYLQAFADPGGPAAALSNLLAVTVTS